MPSFSGVSTCKHGDWSDRLSHIDKCSNGGGRRMHDNPRLTKHQRRITGLIHKPKLTWDQVNEIRRSYVRQSRTRGLKSLAERYGVSVNNIHKIVRGKTWKTIEGDGNVSPPVAGRKTQQEITKAYAQQGQSIKALRRELARLMGQ